MFQLQGVAFKQFRLYVVSLTLKELWAGFKSGVREFTAMRNSVKASQKENTKSGLGARAHTRTCSPSSRDAKQVEVCKTLLSAPKIFALFAVIKIRTVHGAAAHTLCLSGDVGRAFFDAFFGNGEISIGATCVYGSRTTERSLAHIRAVSALLAESATMRAEEILVYALGNWEALLWSRSIATCYLLPLVRCMVLRFEATPGRYACWCILGCWC